MRALMRSAWSGVRSVARALPGRGGSRRRAAASAARFSAWRAAQGAAPRAPEPAGGRGLGACGTGSVLMGGGGRTADARREGGRAVLARRSGPALRVASYPSRRLAASLFESGVGACSEPILPAGSSRKPDHFYVAASSPTLTRAFEHVPIALIAPMTKTVALLDSFSPVTPTPTASRRSRRDPAERAPARRRGRQRSREKRDRRGDLDARPDPRRARTCSSREASTTLARSRKTLVVRGYDTVLTGGGDGTFTVMVTEVVREARKRGGTCRASACSSSARATRSPGSSARAT